MSFTLHRCIWDIPNLDHREFRILSYFAFVADDKSFLAYPKIETVAEKCQCSVRAVQRALAKLLSREDNIIFTVNRRGGRNTTTYQMYFPGMEPKAEKRKADVISFEKHIAKKRRERGPTTKKLAAELQKTNGRVDTLFEDKEIAQ